MRNSLRFTIEPRSDRAFNAFSSNCKKGEGIVTGKLLSPKELGTLVGLSTAQVRALMNDGRLEFVEITPKTRLLTMNGWERFQRRATRLRGAESERDGAVSSVN